MFALPGVPAEMFEMFDQTVEPAIAAALGPRRVIRHRRIKCFGAGESHVEQMLPDLIRRGREPAVGITVHEATITLRISAAGASDEECLAAMQPTLATIRQCLGNLVFGEEDDELEDVVVRLLGERGQSLATVEAGTQGLLAHWLTQAAGESGRYRGGVVLPASGEVVAWLAGAAGPAIDLAASPATEALAAQCRGQFDSDYALAVGVFPPAGAVARKRPTRPWRSISSRWPLRAR